MDPAGLAPVVLPCTWCWSSFPPLSPSSYKATFVLPSLSTEDALILFQAPIPVSCLIISSPLKTLAFSVSLGMQSRVRECGRTGMLILQGSLRSSEGCDRAAHGCHREHTNHVWLLKIPPAAPQSVPSQSWSLEALIFLVGVNSTATFPQEKCH